MLRTKPKELGGDCKDLSTSFVLSLEPLQNRKHSKQSRSLRFGFSEANVVLSANFTLSLLPLPRGL